jgi:pterin-4a-carbinolamine dehydratase
MSSKEGVLKAANMAMKMMKEGKMNEFIQIPAAAAAVAGGLARGAAAAVKHAPKIAKVARGVGRAVKVGKAVGNAASNAYDTSKKVYGTAAESKADKIMKTSTRASFSEYNEFYKELDKAAKQGKKAGDTISVGGKNIKLKSNPKQMHQLTDSDMNMIDALAEKCKSYRK